MQSSKDEKKPIEHHHHHHGLSRTVSKPLPATASVRSSAAAAAMADDDSDYVLTPPSTDEKYRELVAKIQGRLSVPSEQTPLVRRLIGLGSAPPGAALLAPETGTGDLGKVQLAKETCDLMRGVGSGGNDSADHGPDLLKRYQNWIIVNPILNGAATTPVNLTALGQGTTQADRLGARCRIDSVYAKVQFRMSISTTAVAVAQLALPKARIVFYIDNLAILAATAPAPAVAAVWAENVNPAVSFNAMTNTLGATNPTGINSIAPYNLNTHGYRFNILADEVINFDEGQSQGATFMPTGAITQKSAIVNREWSFKNLRMDQVYFSNLSTTNMTKALKYFVIADAAAGWQTGGGVFVIDSGYLAYFGVGFTDTQE